MHVTQCLKVALLLLLLSASVVLIINTLLLTKCHPAVKEKFIAVPLPTQKQLGMDVRAKHTDEREVEPKSNPNHSYADLELQLDVSTGTWDKSRAFKVHPFVVESDKWNGLQNWNICLSSQCSADLLFWVVEQCKTWNGPMSIAVFALDMDFVIAKLMIQYMRTCFPAVRDQVSFHFVYPDLLPPVVNISKSLEYDCEKPEAVNNELVKIFRTKRLSKIIEETRFPQNLLRNIARQTCQNLYSFTPDIDMISIPCMSDQLNEFVARKSVSSCKKCAYIIPTYEISTKANKNPENKTELLQLKKMNQAQQFHIKVFRNNQANSNLSYWEKIPSSPDDLNVAYNITSWQSHWEPIYMTYSSVPAFDERFIGFGFNRNSQTYEMRLAGYTWQMLDGAFLTHRGFQTLRSHSRFREKQITENRGRFGVFVKELHERYRVELNNKEEKEKSDKTSG